MNDLVKYFQDANSLIQSEYERIQKRVKEDPGTAGDSGEENWAELLRNWLPVKYPIVTKGRIINSRGELSPQVDVLVLSENYPKSLLSKKEYLTAGVIAAFECKLTLEPEHIYKAIKTADDISRLVELERDRNWTPQGCVYSPLIYGLLSHSHCWKSPGSNPIDNINSAIQKGFNSAPLEYPESLIDFICVSDLANWSAFKSFDYNTEEILESDTKGVEHKLTDAIHASLTLHHPKIQPSDTAFKDMYTPVGVFIKKLWTRIALEDPTIHRIAQYFSATKIEGVGEVQCGLIFDAQKHIPAEVIAKHKKYLEERNAPGGTFTKWDLYYP